MKSFSTKKYFLSLVGLQLLTYCAPVFAERVTFSFHLDSPSLVSCAVFNHQGNLVKQVSTMEELASGDYTRIWDGFNELSEPVTDRDLQFQCFLNGSTYTVKDSIGNSADQKRPWEGESGGLSDFESYVAPDGSTGMAMARTWSEEMPDNKFQDKNGVFLRSGASGGCPYTVHADGVYAYFVGSPGCSFYSSGDNIITRVKIADASFVPFSVVYTGQIHVLHDLTTIPKDAIDRNDKIYTHSAITSDSQYLYVVDYLQNAILKFDKITGMPAGTFSVNQPKDVAMDMSGRLLVVHDGNRVGLYETSGAAVNPDLIAEGKKLVSIAVAPTGELWVADQGDSRVRSYDISSGSARILSSFGSPASPGDSDDTHFHTLSKIDIDSDGNLTTLDKFTSGLLIIKWNFTTASEVFRHYVTVFGDPGAFNPSHPNEYWDGAFNKHVVNPDGTANFVSNGFEGGSNFLAGAGLSPRILNINGNDYLFTTGFAVNGAAGYRIDNNKTLHLSTLVGNWFRFPGDKKLVNKHYFWSDVRDGSGQPLDEDIIDTWPGNEQFGWDGRAGVERYQGRLLISGGSGDREGTVEIPMEFDARGNPMFKSANARIAVPVDTSFLKMRSNASHLGDDGTYYTIGRSDVWAAEWACGWGACYQYPGGRVFAAYNSNGSSKWKVKVPDNITSFDTAAARNDQSPSDAKTVFLGTLGASILHYVDGVQIGKIDIAKLGIHSGWFDVNGALSVFRNPVNNLIELTGQNGAYYTLRHYQVNDDNVRRISANSVERSSVPTVSLESPVSETSEDTPDKPATLRVSRSGDLSSALSVSWVASGGEATSGLDYRALPNPIVIPAGSASISIPVVPINDGLSEGHETAVFSLVQNSAYLSSDHVSATITILDAAKDLPKITVEAIDSRASTNGRNSGLIRISRSSGFHLSMDVAIKVTGTATMGAEYQAFDYFASFKPGDKYVDEYIWPLGRAVGTPKTVTIEATAPAAYFSNYFHKYDIGSPSVATVTITDDPTSLPNVSIRPRDGSIGSVGLDGHTETDYGIAEVFLENPAPAGGLDVYYEGALAGSVSQQFTLDPPNKVTIPAGQTTAQIRINPVMANIHDEEVRYCIALVPNPSKYEIWSTSANASDHFCDLINGYKIASQGWSRVTMGITKPEVWNDGSRSASIRFRREGNLAAHLTLIGGSSFLDVPYPWDFFVPRVDGVEGSIGSLGVEFKPGEQEHVLTIDANLRFSPRSGTQWLVFNMYPYDNGGEEKRVIGVPNLVVPIYDVRKPGIDVTAVQKVVDRRTETGKFRITRHGSTQGSLEVALTAPTGSGRPGVDFLALPARVVIPDGQAFVDISLTPIQSSSAVGDKIITLSIAEGSAYSLPYLGLGDSITIRDGASAPAAPGGLRVRGGS